MSYCKICIGRLRPASKAGAMRFFGTLLLAHGLFFANVFPSSAQTTGGQSLDQAANDPTAFLMSLQLQNFYSPNLHNSDENQNILQFRAAIPFTLGGVNNIARLTLP